jgi:hypothetical protein
VKEEHIINTRKLLKYDSQQIDCIKDSKFIIRNKSLGAVNKPVNKRDIMIQRFDPQTLSVFLFVNGVGLKIVDQIKILPSSEIILESNYQIEIDGELEISTTIDVLNHLYSSN